MPDSNCPILERRGFAVGVVADGSEEHLRVVDVALARDEPHELGSLRCMIFGTSCIEPVWSKMMPMGVEFGCSLESRDSRILPRMSSDAWTPDFDLARADVRVVGERRSPGRRPRVGPGLVEVVAVVRVTH